MALDRQIYCYSIATDAFYEPNEQKIHTEMLKLYELRKVVRDNKLHSKNTAIGIENDYDFWKSNINKLIADDKTALTEMLNARLNDHTPRTLNPNAIKDKNVITLFDSTLTRALGAKPKELTDDIMVLNVFFFQVLKSLMLDGYIYNNEKYIFLTASAGQIRTKRAVFIKESAFKRIEQTLMCGLTVDEINEHGGINSNKYLAYLALCNSATDVWQDFDIDKSIVVEDFETDVDGEVDFIDEKDYSITRKMTKTTIPHMDGCGIMLDETTRMVRLPWVKGLLVTFPFDKFIEENGNSIVTDIYGVEHDVIAEGIKYIFTKSQFKLWKYYPSWECYKARFKACNCEAAYCNLEDAYIPKAKINYQMLQTLSDMRDDEIEKITRRTVDEINNVGSDYRTTMKLLGATAYNKTPNYFQQGLMLYPELFRDAYHKEILKQTKKSLVKQARGGRLAVNGRYQFLAPDLYAFCQWLFNGDINPSGLLADGEVYSKLNRDNAELACLRSPHLYREWAIRTNRRNAELDKWFGMTKCVYTSCHDLISRYLMFDVDGDKALVVQDRTLTACAKRNMQDIRPLAYELRKAKGELLTSENLYDGIIHAYVGGNIGLVSNSITKVWNSGSIGDEQINVVKWLCLYNNAVIDYAKTLWLPTPPKEIDEIIKSYTRANVPHFFIYSKDKEDERVEAINESTMNRISVSIPSPRVKYNKSIKKFDYQMLMNHDADFTIRRNPIIEAYDYWQKNWMKLANDEEIHTDQDDLWAFKQVRERLLALGEHDYVVNTLIAYSYTKKINSTKKMLWACFGKEIVDNLKKNTADLGNICPICGKRFVPQQSNHVCCSAECSQKFNAEKVSENSVYLTCSQGSNH